MNLFSRLATAAIVALILTSLAALNAHAAPFSIDWVTVGNPGNASDPATGNLYGAVAEEYRIMKFEFTNTQYAAFLNAIDPDGTNPNSIWHIAMGSDQYYGLITNTGTAAGSRYAVKANMGEKPVTFVSWFSVARVSNWLHKGAQTYDSTDASANAPQNTGAYTVGTATSGGAVAKNPGALFYVPTENEWYKAAYYNATLNNGTGGYRVYGNGFDTPPGTVLASAAGDGSAGGTGNFANYNNAVGRQTTVGTNGAASYYGAFDMSGNVWELTDLDGDAGSSRGRRGGGYELTDGDYVSSSSGKGSTNASLISNADGFRLAAPVAVPEPSTYAMALAGIACGGYLVRRRRKRA